ncbi:hypothetical protein BLS_010036 [Venturia inaequalis]|uniref:Nuclear condensin complex subunit 3 C-terminal domain-containing protein n=1 Tax=Venturia inaequalis TaxID=5025 RepID=A0A8H3YWI8_VENIN|nr:hypothetical protein EG328_003783 [Venturia inaequalis]KAE9978758.1 hypothetical protein EG327_007281 [Venturia inaequalis]KAE9979220.1 hypothetical protein BLS_010036 [Venturia inaequalis]RDI76772.1 hypothetical protein Vi05172_g13243 [Venturia inaequalis]
MPGRTSVRANVRAARNSDATVSRKSSTTTLKSRASSTRSSAYAVQIPDEGEVTSLREAICSIFSDAQRGAATQRKSVVTLRKVQEACCYESAKPRKNALDQDYDESEFNEEVGRCALRLLGIRKAEPVGDRLIKFMMLFLKHSSEKDNALFQTADADTTEGVPETPTSRLASHILSMALQVMVAKDKTIRYRATQLIAQIVNTLDSIDDQLFHLVRHGLLKRLRDKESTVRVQAVIGLGPLANEDDEEQDEDDSDDETPGGVLGRLREALQHDPSADVRRALLLNLPFTPGTLPYLLERARDLDAATRRALYARLLPALGDFRYLSLTHREKLLRWGLRDRDENVRKATARLFRERWIEDCAKPQGEEEEAPSGPPKVHEPSMAALLELLERIDSSNSGLENGIAHEAMKEFWDGRPDYREHVTFEDPFFEELSPESAFVARTFTDFCSKSGDSKLQTMLEDKMPEVTKFAFLLQMHITKLIDAVNKVGMNPDDADVEEEAVQQEFCLEQLLHIGATLDFSDEMGRRKMFQIMREALALAELPDESTRLVMDILRTVCGSEEEFASIALEAIAEVHDTISDDAADESDGDESFHSAQSELNEGTTPTKKSKKKAKNPADEDDTEVDAEKALREMQVNLKCLHIAQCMLQNVQCNLEASSHLRTMLNSLVIPAVQSHEAPVRERGLKCMGLCCLLSKNLSEENLVLFLHCFNKGHDTLQDIAIQIISDILVTHPSLLAGTPTTDEEGNTEVAPNPLMKPLLKMYSKGLRSPDKAVQTTAGTALSKLMLAATIQDLDLLRHMVLSYFDPETGNNPAFRQSLAYFLPVYCHSRRRNAEAMARVAVPVLHALAERAEDLDEDEEMIGTTLVAAQICDWTDPRKTVPGIDGTVKTDPGDLDGHLVLAEELLEKILTPGCQKEERKTYVNLLGKLYFTPGSPPEHLQNLFELANEAFEGKVASEAATRNTLTKVQNAISKLLAAAGSSPAPKDASEDVPVDSTEVAPDTSEVEASEADATEIPDADEELDVDMTLGMNITNAPDAEGTVFGDYDDDSDETVKGDELPVRIKREQGVVSGDESLVERLLGDDSSIL